MIVRKSDDSCSYKDVIAQIAEIEYSLFVVNTQAAGVQGENGIYYTKYFPVTPFVLENMIRHGGSLGCYQQVYRSDRIRWICFDFDCAKGTTVDLDGLYNECVSPVTSFLDTCGIRYLQEFSGRRGIHIWVILDKQISKKQGHMIINTIIDAVPELKDALESGRWGLDKFPANGVRKKSKVGKQVKFPLSCHTMGGRSFFFVRDLPAELRSSEGNRDHDGQCCQVNAESSADVWSDEFYIRQLNILRSFEMESYGSVLEKLGLSDEDEDVFNHQIYRRYKLISNYTGSIDSIITILSETAVYKNIFNRMAKGQAVPNDWLVLLGTFSCFTDGTIMLIVLFERYPNYDVRKTITNIRKFKDKYYPATFGYLYRLYDMTMEDGLNPEMTGVDYLSHRLSLDVEIKQRLHFMNERECLESIENVVRKEREYIIENDEVISVEQLNRFNSFKKVELKKIEDKIEQFVSEYRSDAVNLPRYTIYERHEDEKKVRKLVSLDPVDRLITTSLVLRLCRELKHTWKSYSYCVSFMEADNLFYPWFSSWRRYIDQIKVYLYLPFMGKNHVCYLDLRQCYDHIDMLVIYRKFRSELSDKGRSAFEFLCQYNDLLMMSMSEGRRIGVPQGPAYARILTEIYLDRVIDGILEPVSVRSNQSFKLFRYVDDIVVFCEDEFVARDVYDTLVNGFFELNLPVNIEKSQYYGRIADLEPKDRDKLLHRTKFNYDLMDRDSDAVMYDKERNARLMRFLKGNPFQINLLGYVFSVYSYDEAKRFVFYNYGEKIFESVDGRGKYFRQFYRYMLGRSDMVSHALKEGWFNLIPLVGINFDNYVSTLYFMIQDEKISDADTTKIILRYLDDEFPMDQISETNRTTIYAIKRKYPVG